MADNNEHTFYYSNLWTQTRDAQNAARINIYDPTDINTKLLTSVSSTTDAVVYDEDYTTYCGYDWDASAPATNIWGLTTCVSINSALECEKHEIRYDVPDVLAMTSNARIGLACHETGHSVGLKHLDNPTGDATFRGCMYTLADPTYWPFLSPHDVGHINANY